MFAQVAGAQLFYDVAGPDHRRPVVLVHAGIADCRMWDGQVATLAGAGQRVIRFDLRGFGRSTKPPLEFAYHEDVHRLLRALGIAAPVAVVGISLGSRIALDYALAFPEAVAALVLGAPALAGFPVSEAWQRFDAEEEEALERGDTERAVEVTLRMWVDGPRRTPDLVDPVLRARAAELIRHQLALPLVRVRPRWPDPPALRRLGEVRVPTLVVVGDLDTPDVRAIAERLVADIPGARLAVVPGAAHLINMEQPGAFDRLVVDFLGPAVRTVGPPAAP